MNNYKEPWILHRGQNLNRVREPGDYLVTDKDDTVICENSGKDGYLSYFTIEQIERVVACVNAMNGIEDPERWVLAAKSAMESYKAEAEAIRKAWREEYLSKMVPCQCEK